MQFSQILPLNEIWIWLIWLNTLSSWLLYAADVRDCLTDKKKWKCYAWSYTEDSHCVNLQLDQQKMTVSDDIFHDLLCVWRNQKFWIFNFEPNKKDEKIDSPAFHYKYFNVSNRIKWGLLIVTIKQIAIHIDIMVKKLKIKIINKTKTLGHTCDNLIAVYLWTNCDSFTNVWWFSRLRSSLWLNGLQVSKS